MTLENNDETKPTPVVEDTQPTPVPDVLPLEKEDQEDIRSPIKTKRVKWYWWLLLSILVVITIVIASGLLGYWSGIQAVSYTHLRAHET